MFTALHSLHCTTTTPHHLTEPPVLHRTSLHCNPTIPLNFTALHPLHCTTTTTLHFAVLQPNYSTEFYWTAPTTLHPSISLHCTHYTSRPLLHCTSLLGAVLHNALPQHCMPLHFTAWCCALRCTVFHSTSPVLDTTVFHCTARCSTLHFTSTSLHCTAPSTPLQCTHYTSKHVLHCTSILAVLCSTTHFTSTACTLLHGAVLYTVFHCSSPAQHSIAFYCTVQSPAQHFTSASLHYTLLHGAAPFGTVFGTP